MEEFYYQLATAVLLLASVFFAREYTIFKTKLSQARNLIDAFDDATKEEGPGGEKVTEQELKGIVAALKALLS